ncbi:TetR/AcrR family transcriptional regulator [Acidiferrimicrobium sp. IK]|uniref:TetR/AcrR family transcriptional regulator n=1 Tax=Acidiferrimicrobium sp. IK TaxID=2871700 RepID=UPI0021CB002A|nr:TetR/AcrR family transcriptional regulator [Acidiferrimicrobium sp. IK]MCU4186817.1 TetR/AcrR family transcriptional regulator [Acidiferrimicrobium sp. IK]
MTAAPGARRPPHPTAALILRAAEGVFPKLGYSQTTMADLAAAAGVTRPTVYAYFASKADVFRAVAESVRDDILAVQEQASGETPAETARLGVVGYLDAYVRHLGVLTVLSHQALSDPAMGRLRDEIHDRANRRHTRFIERLAAAGQARPVVPAPVLSEAVTGVVMRLAEQIAARPDRRGELAGHLAALHRTLLGL